MAETINKELLAQKAEVLKDILDAHSSNPDVKDLRADLIPLLNDALHHRISKSINRQSVPGNAQMYRVDMFHEFRDLKNAYADFQTEITGLSDSPALKWLEESRANKETKLKSE